MDVEFITDHDTEDALLQWCAVRRRREVIPSRVFLLVVALFVLVEWQFVWHLTDDVSFVLWFAVLLQVAAVAFAVFSRDPAHTGPYFDFPQAELIVLGLFTVSMIVTFTHRPSVVAFLLLAIVLAALAALTASGWHAFDFVRDRVPFYGQAQHIHLDAEALAITVRPRPTARSIPWKKVRYLGADADTIFIVAGVVPVVVPRRAFATSDQWEAFLDAAAKHAQRALKSSARGPIWRHVRRPKARRA